MQIFVAHSKKDRGRVLKLVRKLRQIGFDTWLDEHQMLAGANWKREIYKAIKECDLCLVCLSSNWVTKQSYVHEELRVALDAASRFPEDKVFVIPVRLDDCEIPGKLKDLHWIDLFKGWRAKKLYADLATRLKQHKSKSSTTLKLKKCVKPGKNEHYSILKGLVEDTFGGKISKKNLDADFIIDLGADSLDVVDLIMTVEETFDVNIPDNEADGLNTPRLLLKWLDSNL